MGPVAGLGVRRSRVLGTPGAHVLPPCQLASWPPGAGLSFAQLKPLWPVAACSTPSAAEVVAMPLLPAVPSGWGRGGRVVAAPVEFHLSGGAPFCRRSSCLEECHPRRRARGRRGAPSSARAGAAGPTRGRACPRVLRESRTRRGATARACGALPHRRRTPPPSSRGSASDAPTPRSTVRREIAF